MGRKAWQSVEAAETEAAQRFWPRGWATIVQTWRSVRPELRSLARVETGAAKLAKAVGPLDRAAKQLRRAAGAFAAAEVEWRHMSPEEVGLPPSLLGLGARGVGRARRRRRSRFHGRGARPGAPRQAVVRLRGSPPTRQAQAVETVMKQAELLAV